MKEEGRAGQGPKKEQTQRQQQQHWRHLGHAFKRRHRPRRAARPGGHDHCSLNLEGETHQGLAFQ
eukprot:5664783-Lingulodinium_polyedra.AAC.1